VILGLHHVTAIAGDPQRNLEFHTRVLGLRLVKTTVNFDDPTTYHLYYGDEAGRPGTLITFFPWSSAARRGRAGAGQITVISFSIPKGSTGYWRDRLKEHAVGPPAERFGDEVITFRDPDGFAYELVASSPAAGRGVPAIRGLHGVTLTEQAPELTAQYLASALAFRPAGEAGDRVRLEAGPGGAGSYVELLPGREQGIMGVGAVHHVAWRVADDGAQLALMEALHRSGTDTTPVIDRTYFHSIYFHEPGGVICEVATDPPGFMVDERLDELGTHLMLPGQYEQHRSEIERALPPLDTVRIS
jgi:glyoxalase family protein